MVIEFGSEEWATQEKVTWTRNRRRAWVWFWTTWAWLCVLVWLIAQTPAGAKLSLLCDGFSFAIALNVVRGCYQMAKIAEGMIGRVDEMREAFQALEEFHKKIAQ